METMDNKRTGNGTGNTAIIPVPKLEDDFYDWWARHEQVLAIKDRIDPEIVLIGDSITHMWGGEPEANVVNGAEAWASVFAGYRVLNLGFGWDRTQNVLWRLENGELDGLHPHTVVINIGTNNTNVSSNAPVNTPAEIQEGLRAICDDVRRRTPGASLVVMAVFPREESPDHPRRKEIAEINRLRAEFAEERGYAYLDIASLLLAPDGTLTRDMAADFCHPTNKGYRIWADALRPMLPQR